MAQAPSAARVTVMKDGPYLVSGGVPLCRQTVGTDASGGSEAWVPGDAIATRPGYALCRCGHSGTKPFCDGTHANIGFDGAETARREPYLAEAEVIDGPAYQLLDVRSLCAGARFCDPHGGVWDAVQATSDADAGETFLRQVESCPSGRLAARDKGTGALLEPALPLSIGLVEDPAEDCSGPLWLRGGIPVIAADGFRYETRNRVTLCRCGESKNKPFCDGTHISVKFRDD